jgi:molybdopterin molybdotransferase
MLSLADARARLLAMARPLPVESAPLAAAAGRPLAAPVFARRTQPAAPLSAMDGYAVRAAEAPGPWRVAFAQAAGAPPPPPLGAGEAARIFTGAIVPDGADAILIQEQAERDGDALRAHADATLAPGQHVRPAGLDFAHGAALLGVGEPLTPAAIGLAAAMGHAALPVRRIPRVALLATGDELVPPGDAPPAPGRIVEAVRPMLAALLRGRADVTDLGVAPDRAPAVAAAIARGRDADVLVTIGGASVGDHDLVRPALEAAGGAIDAWKVAIRPGKPLVIGRLGDALVLGLPGNPASAYVTSLLFLLPLLRALAGHARPFPSETPARLAAPLPANGPRRDHLRAALAWRGTERWATPRLPDDSSVLSALAVSDALIVREPHAAPAPAGAEIFVLDTDSRDS